MDRPIDKLPAEPVPPRPDREYLPECGHCNPNAPLLLGPASEGEDTVMRRAFGLPS